MFKLQIQNGELKFVISIDGKTIEMTPKCTETSKFKVGDQEISVQIYE